MARESYDPHSVPRLLWDIRVFYLVKLWLVVGPRPPNLSTVPPKTRTGCRPEQCQRVIRTVNEIEAAGAEVPYGRREL